MKECLFCKIANKELPADIIYEVDIAIVFKDIHPQKPVHWLIIPKSHISSLNEIDALTPDVTHRLLSTIAKLAKEHGFSDNGYRVIFNTNAHGGQVVDHLHIHILAGAPVGAMVQS
jgi:histidine triad (HIT) family protein